MKAGSAALWECQRREPRLSGKALHPGAAGAACPSEQKLKENIMEEKLQRIKEEAAKRIQESDSLDKLNEVRVAFLGKKGELTAVLKGMKDVAPEDRPKVGQWVNEARAEIEELLENTKKPVMGRKQ